MPWKEIKIMDQREYFVGDYLTGDYPKGALCELSGISRPTGDKWLARYHAQGGARGHGAAAAHAATPDPGGGSRGHPRDEAPPSEFWAEEDSGSVTGGRARGSVAGG